MQEIVLTNRTIVLTIGPTGCGKTHFIENYIVPQLEQSCVNTKIVSVNNKRSFIVGKQKLSKDDFYYSSEGAYNMAKSEIECLTTYPTNKYVDVLIVDSSGMDTVFLTQIFKIAEKNNYNVCVIVFDFKDIRQYLEHSSDKSRTVQQRITMYNKIFPFLKQQKMITIEKINKNFDQYIFEQKCTRNYVTVECEKKIIIITSLLGDINVLEKIKETKISSGDFVVIMGNYIGTDVKIIANLFNYVKQIPTSVIILKGHMEKLLQNKIKKGTMSNELINNIYSNMTPQDIEMFNWLWGSSFGYAQVGKYEITTSLCERQMLECIDSYNYEDDIDKLISDHYFVHVCNYPLVTKVVKLKSNLFVGKNGGLCIINHNGRTQYKLFPTQKSQLYENFKVIDTKHSMVSAHKPNYEQANSYVINRINQMATNCINYISGTISPSDKKVSTRQLESITTALEYYHNMYKNTGLISIQVKDMGSRFQFYYFVNEREKSFGVSRNGYIRNIDQSVIDRIYDNLTPKLTTFDQYEGSYLIIIDGELMPWSTFGQGLIDTQFKMLHKSAKKELDFLQNSGFEEKQQQLIEEYNSSNFASDISIMKAKDVSTKYKKYETYKCLKHNAQKYISIEQQKIGIDIFAQQMENFGASCSVDEITYKPFSILKFCYSDTELIPNETNCILGNVEMYSKLSENNKLTIDLADNLQENIAKVQEFWDTVIIQDKFEGIIVKPDFVNPLYAPCLKVRNSHYLHIIYGPDYLNNDKYSALLQKKNIKGKLETSIKEYNIGLKMLAVPFSKIESDDDNVEIKNLYHMFIEEEEKEKTYDKAL